MEDEEVPKLTEEDVADFCISLIRDCIVQAASENYEIWLNDESEVKVRFSIKTKWAKEILRVLDTEVPLPDDVIKTVEKLTGQPMTKRMK